MKRTAPLLYPTLILALLLAACGAKTGSSAAVTSTPAPVSVVAEGHLVPNQSVYLAFPAGGHVAGLPVKKGDKVSQGQVLASLDDRQQAEAAVAAAQLELTTAQQQFDALNRTVALGRAQAWQAWIQAQKTRGAAQAAWDALNLNTIQTDIDNANADVASRRTDLENAQKDFDKYSNLPADNATRKSYEDRLRTAQSNYDAAVRKAEDLTNNRDSLRAALDAALGAEAEAKRTYDNTQGGPNTDKLALAQARLDGAKAQLAAAQNALDNYDLKAPFAGTVVDTNVTVGQLIGPDTWAVVIADTSRWYVDTSDLTEQDVVRVAVGQKVQVTADALPGVVMTGVVEQIVQAPKTSGGDVVYTVHILMDKVDPRLFWGMTMEVTFLQ
jgi:multidrug resistance efflux pump